MILNAFELQRYLSACAEKADCSVVYEDTVQPRTDGKVVYLPHVSMFTTEDTARELIFFVNHETSHIRYTGFKDIPEYKWMSPMYSLLGLVWGFLEDTRVDYLNDRQYMGDRDCHMFVDQKYFKKFTSSIEPADQETKDRLHSILMFCNHCRMDLYPDAQIEQDELEQRIASPKAKEYFSNMKDLDIDKDFLRVRGQEHKIVGTRGTAAVAMDIWERVFEDSVDKEKEKMEQILKAIEEGKGAGDTLKITMKKGGGHEERAEASESSDKNESKKRATDSEFRIDIVDYSKFAPDKCHNLEPNGSIHNVGLKIDVPPPIGAAAYKQPDIKDYPVLNFQHPEKSTIGVEDKWVEPNSPQQKEYLKNINKIYVGKQLEGFANQLRRLIQIKSKGRHEYGTPRGKLQRSLVHRVTMKDSPLSSKIFKRHIKSNVDDCAITILVDCSGSMSGTKYLHASCAMMILSETISNVLRIPLEVIGFTDGHGFADSSRGYNKVAEDMHLIRQFNEQQVGRQDLSARMATVASMMGANADGEAIVFALDRLLKQKQKRKIMIVLSDGQPVTSRHGDISSYTRNVVKRMEQTPDLTVVGIGIMSKAVEKYYKHYRVINNADEIEQTLLDVLRQSILEDSLK